MGPAIELNQLGITQGTTFFHSKFMELKKNKTNFSETSRVRMKTVNFYFWQHDETF